MLSTKRIARACARRPWTTLAAWALMLVLAVVAIALLLELTTEGRITSNPESARGYEAIGRHFPPDPASEYVNEVIVVRSRERVVEDSAFRDKTQDVLAAVRASGVAHNAESFYETMDASLASRSRHATIIPIGLSGDCEAGADRLLGIVEAADGGRFDVTVTGECTADRDLTKILDEDLKTGELYFGLPAALVILVLVFGALVAAVLPLVTAIISIVVALGISALIGQAFDLSVYLVTMLTVMGLAIATDYALFILTRYREERASGRSQLDAIEAAGATASRAVVFSGLAFALAMSGLLLIPDTVLRSLGVGAIAVAVTSVAAALTLLPALLGLLGDRVDALRVPLVGRTVEHAGREGRFWSRVANVVMRRPVVYLVASVALLLEMAVPVIDLRLATSGVRAFPDGTPAKEGFLALEDEFRVGTVDSVLVAVEGDVTREPVATAVRRLTRKVGASERFRNPTLEVSPDRRLAVVEALVVGDSRDVRSLNAVKRLRTRGVPSAFRGTDAKVYVTGESAEEVDYRELSRSWLPRIVLFVLCLSFVLLTIAFRSVVLALKAIGLNLLVVGAAYGLLVVVFQKGYGSDLLGLRNVDAVTPWVPLFLFAVVFGLSMDYHVFLLSRIRERYLLTGDNREAVAQGVGTTARVITGAALIIIAVFAGFASGDLVESQQVGFGVGIALLIDATIVRSILVPATMTLLGRWNWYLPDWLGWLPDPHMSAQDRNPPAVGFRSRENP